MSCLGVAEALKFSNVEAFSKIAEKACILDYVTFTKNLMFHLLSLEGTKCHINTAPSPILQPLN